MDSVNNIKSPKFLRWPHTSEAGKFGQGDDGRFLYKRE
jgi:hypothetical protein